MILFSICTIHIKWQEKNPSQNCVPFDHQSYGATKGQKFSKIVEFFLENFYKHPYKEGEKNFIKKPISSFYTNDSQSSIFALFLKYLAHYAIIRDLWGNGSYKRNRIYDFSAVCLMVWQK